MEWTEEHDVLLLREILGSNVFVVKKGSPARGLAWEAIVESLNKIDSPKFQLKDRRAVGERWVLLRKKFTKKMSEEEKESGISVDDLTEREALIEELVSREDTATADADFASKQQDKDKETAEDIRKKAMETLRETKKRKSEKDASPKRRKSGQRCAQPLVDFLREKADADREVRRQELDMKKKEQENQQQVMQSLLQEQQKMNGALLAVLQKVMEK